ncbi:MAG: AAA family ATPase [Candidatus Melainabacteria bacterium]|nr:AAA family ATPase [Candidatus Melainabacteria bacterium]
MHLKSIYIADYKNLKEFKLTFDGASFLDVFVGKNGTGKSNFFEALIEIFHHLLEPDKENVEPGFDYSISYEIDGVNTEISWLSGRLIINGKRVRAFGRTPRPDHVLIYYSGHNTTVASMMQKHEEALRRRIRRSASNPRRHFVGIGHDYKELLLALLLMQAPTNRARGFVANKLSIRDIGLVLKLVLRRPSYAQGTEHNIDDPDEHMYWRLKGPSKIFLDRLSKCKENIDESKTIRSEGYFPNDEMYIHYFAIEKVREEFTDLSPQALFHEFDNLKTLDMLAEMSLPIVLQNGREANTGHFSDGQFQSVYIYSIVELFKDRNCITLLDEPDSFLHPEWQFEFLQQVFEITAAASSGNHLLMSSHSAVTLIPHNSRKIRFFDIKDNHAHCYEVPKTVAIKKMSSDVIRYSEHERLLSVINTIQIEKKPVLFTEGSTDPLILKEAWYKLYDEEIPFIPFFAFSCSYIKNLLTDNRITAEMDGLPVFALFDFDQAYNHWNGMNGEVLQNDVFKGLVKKWADGESYAIMLPIPANPRIRAQVIKEPPQTTFGGESCCEIEHLFYGTSTTESYFHEEPAPGGSKIVFRSDDEKTDFARTVVPLLRADCFEVFRPMFEFIRSKCVDDADKVSFLAKA